jgi:hypothetical protein
LLEVLDYLRSIYIPEVRGSRRRLSSADVHRREVSSISCTEDSLAFDEFERSYAIRWLTCLISQSEGFLEHDATHCQRGAPNGCYDAFGCQREKILQEAASLLAICAGAASSGSFTRIFSFTYTQAGAENVVEHFQVRLSDAPLENHDYSSVGAQTWGSACVLADLLVESPESFGLRASLLVDEAESVFRVLELGAGTGLVSLTLGKLLGALPKWKDTGRKVSIYATDFHPSVLENLRANILLNFPGQDFHNGSAHISVEACFLDWSGVQTGSNPFDVSFDLVLGVQYKCSPRQPLIIFSGP